MSGRSIVALILVGALALAGCSDEDKAGESTSKAPRSAPETNVGSLPEPSRITWSVAEGKPAGAVDARVKKAWKARWPSSIRPFEVNTEADKIVASVYSKGFSGIALIDARTGEIADRVDEFDDADTYQALGEANDRYAVWKEFHSLDNLDEFVVKKWDRESDTVRQIGASHKAKKDQHTFPSPWQAPVVEGGRAAWVEGVDDDSGGELLVVDLTNGTRFVVPSAHPGWLTFNGNTLMWAESPARGADTELYGIDVRTRESIALPPGLQELRGAGFLVTDGSAAAWVKSDATEVALFATPDVNKRGVKITSLNNDGLSPPLLMTSHAIGARISGGGLIVLDRETGHFAIHRDVAGAEIAGSSMLLGPQTLSKQRRAATSWAVLSPADSIDITGVG